MPFHPVDWTDCPLVEVNPRKVSGVPILKGTRMQADSIVENYESGSPVDEISENFRIPEDTIRAVLAFTGRSSSEAQSPSSTAVDAATPGSFQTVAFPRIEAR